MARITKKKGFFFTLDALFATILIGLALVLTSKYFISEVEQPQINYYSQDIVTSLSNIKITEVDDPYIQSLINSSEIINLNNSIIEQIGEFYVLNKTELARNLSIIVSEKLVPDKFGFEILVNDESIYLNDSPTGAKTELVSSRRLISGIEKFKPLKGATSKVFLEGIMSKKHSSYLYFGGFVGQGNITQNITDIPSDASLTLMEMELDVGGDFRLYINNNPCQGLFHPISNLTIAERWNITSCEGSINPGKDNKIDIVFETDLNKSYIAGGFIRADYITQQLSSYFEGYKIRYNFPGISGITNLYDAFYVPGTINEMNIILHFFANETSYLTVGGKIIHKWSGSDSDQYYNITNQNLSMPEYAFLDTDYPLFSNNTVPVRFASYESITKVITGGNADVVLITDLSGSMKKAVSSWDMGNAGPDCMTFYDHQDTRRTRAAICLDIVFTDIVMNYTGNRVWPIFLRDNQVVNYTWDPSNKDDVDDTLNNYYNDQGKDKTCIACTINQAYDLLAHYSNESRNKFIVLMTDGVPTHCALGSCESNSTIYGNLQCDGLCDTSGACGQTSIPTLCDNCKINDGAVNNSLYSAQRARDDLNVTIYTIGFGPIDDCTLANETLYKIAQIGNGTYQHSKNVSRLLEIYENISYEILESIEQASQPITERGNLTDSILYSDSYIEVEYIPIAEQPAFDEIAISVEETKFSNCTPTFNIPSQMRVTDAKVTSYSGEHWADFLSINGKQVYNLSSYFLSYVRLGDPFFIYIPVNNIINGTNSLKIETGDSPVNRTGCSLNNTIIYTGLIKSSISYAAVLPKSEGCNWTIEFEDGTNTILGVPQEYIGSKKCYYTSACHDGSCYDQNDSIDSAAFQLFDNLDYDDDGQLYVNIDEYNLVVNAISVQQIPYPWGPALAEVRVWR